MSWSVPEGLREVVVGAQVERRDLVGLLLWDREVRIGTWPDRRS